MYSIKKVFLNPIINLHEREGVGVERQRTERVEGRRVERQRGREEGRETERQRGREEGRKTETETETETERKEGVGKHICTKSCYMTDIIT